VNYLSKLNITQLKRPAKASPQEKRRSNLIAKLDEQLALAKAQAAGEKFVVLKHAWTRDDQGNKTKIQREKKVTAWWFADGSALSMSIKYGARQLELSKGKRAVTVANLAAIPETISTVISAVTAGELDAAIEAVVQAGKAKPARN
jgi:hypothetical protein